MATEEDGARVLDGPPRPDEHARGTNDETTLKRKASLVRDDDDHEKNDSEVKRKRQDAYEQPLPAAEATSELPPHGESPPRRRPSGHGTPRDGPERDSAIQEEKRRGKRLFGGLLSTLSQTGTNSSQHRRRQEIEQRQKERLQKQRDEDDQKRAEKLSKIREARLAEHIHFQERVMRHRHGKMLAVAEFLKTRAEPAIYYLPWKRTVDQEDIIEEQIRATKSTIAEEEEEFEGVKERHAIRYGLRRDSHHHEDDAEKVEREKTMQESDVGADEVAPAEAHEEVQKSVVHHDAHDESGDVLVDADEDMVIY